MSCCNFHWVHLFLLSCLWNAADSKYINCGSAFAQGCSASCQYFAGNSAYSVSVCMLINLYGIFKGIWLLYVSQVLATTSCRDKKSHTFVKLLASVLSCLHFSMNVYKMYISGLGILWYKWKERWSQFARCHSSHIVTTIHSRLEMNWKS